MGKYVNNWRTVWTGATGVRGHVRAAAGAEEHSLAAGLLRAGGAPAAPPGRAQPALALPQHHHGHREEALGVEGAAEGGGRRRVGEQVDLAGAGGGEQSWSGGLAGPGSGSGTGTARARGVALHAELSVHAHLRG